MKSLGHVEDFPDDRDWVGLGMMMGVGAGYANSRYAEALDCRSFCAPVRDQGATNKCVGEAVCAVVDTQARLIGRVQPYGSPDAAYAIGRALEVGFEQPLLDLGSRPRFVVRGIQKYGLVSLERWNPGPEGINVKPPFDVLHMGSSSTIKSYTRIVDDVASQLALAIANGFVPMFAMKVDQAYMDWNTSAVYPGLRGPALGGHMQAIVGYDLATSTAEPYFIVRNSWGPDWAMDGYAKVSSTFLAGSDVSDIYVLRSTPWPA